MSKTIRIDDDIWEVLKSKAIPLEDTPSDVLRRIFCDCGLMKEEPGQAASVQDSAKQEILDTPIKEVLSGHTCRGLHFANVRTIGDLVQMTEEKLSRTHYIGRKSLNEIKKLLADHGLILVRKTT